MNTQPEINTEPVKAAMGDSESNRLLSNDEKEYTVI